MQGDSPSGAVDFSFWDGEQELARFALPAGEFVVGRGESCDVIIEAEGMALAQVRLRIGEYVVVENLDPQAGTLLDGEILSSPALLAVGQTISFAQCSGTLRLAGELAMPPPDRGDAESPGSLENEERASEYEALRRELEFAREEILATQAAGEEERAELRRQLAEHKRSTAAKAELEARLTEVEAARAAQHETSGRALQEAQTALQAAEARFEHSELEANRRSEALQAKWESEMRTLRKEWATEKETRSAEAQEGDLREAQLREEILWLKEVWSDAEAEAQLNLTNSRLLREAWEAERVALEEQLCSQQSRHEEERRILQLEVTKAQLVGPAGTEADAAQKNESRDLVSAANKVLFKKLKEAAEAEKDNEALRKELKQREVALVEAWTDRQRADERAAQLHRQVQQLETNASPAPASPPPVVQFSRITLALAAILVVALALGAFWTSQMLDRVHHAEAIVSTVQKTAPHFHEEALALMKEARFREALETLDYAIALAPNAPEYYHLKGNAHESLLQLPAAAAAYGKALDLDMTNTAARANLDLCRRLLGTRQGAASAESQYALHLMMMEQKRLPEALAMAHRLSADKALLHKTWAAIFEQARLPARLELNEDGTFDVDLSGPGRPDLSVFAQMPVRSLNLARSNIVDLSALKGMALQHLDLASTRVHDLEALRGMPLESLNLAQTEVSNLFPLDGMRLQELVLDGTMVSDISMLQGMPLTKVQLAGTRVSSIQGLSASPLRAIDLSGTRVADLSPLKHLPVERLQLSRTAVVDLSPLAGAPLLVLTLTGTEIKDLRPLQTVPLRELALDRCEMLVDAHPLASCTSLERLVLPAHLRDVAFLRQLPSLRFLAYEKNGSSNPEQTASEFWLAFKEATKPPDRRAMR